MADYGILRNTTNTGLTSELIAILTAPVSIKSNRPDFVSDSLSLKRRAVISENQRWEISGGLQPFDNVGEFFANLIVNGNSTPFYIRVPQIYRSTRIPDNLTPSTSSSYVAGGNTVTVSNMGAYTLPVGEFVRFANHSKVYMVKQAIYDGGVNHLTLFPKLHASLAINEAMTYGAKVTMGVYYDESVSLEYQDGILATINNVTFIESL